MTYEESGGETFAARVLTWALIAGAALLFLEVTWSPAMQAPSTQTANVQTVTVAEQHHPVSRS